jgi:hypothetical protein
MNHKTDRSRSLWQLLILLVFTIALLSVSEGVSAAAPRNDLYANAITFPSYLVTWDYTQNDIYNATSSGDPSAKCIIPDIGPNPVTIPIKRTVWYKYTPPLSGSVMISTKGSNYDTVLAVYTGSAPTTPSQKACNDAGDLEYGRVNYSRLTVQMAAGTPYWIMVGQWYYDNLNPTYLRFTITANDFFSNARVIPAGTAGWYYAPPEWVGGQTSGTNIYLGSTVGRTNQSTDPNQQTDPIMDPIITTLCPSVSPRNYSNTVWFNYRPTVSRSVTINTGTSTYNTVLAVYTGSAPNTLSQKACNDNFGGYQSQVTLSMTAGVTYRIMVANYGTTRLLGNHYLYLKIFR